MVKIGVHIQKLSQKQNRGTVFLDYPGIGKFAQYRQRHSAITVYKHCVSIKRDPDIINCNFKRD